MLQAQVDKWGKYWGKGDNDTDELTWEAAAMPNQLTAGQLRKVATSFPAHTSARDGWHPRVFSELSQGALAALADVYTTVEHVGDFPPSIRQRL